MSFDTTALPASLPGPVPAGSAVAEPRDVSTQDQASAPSAFEQMLAVAAGTDTVKAESSAADPQAADLNPEQTRSGVSASVVLIQAQTATNTDAVEAVPVKVAPETETAQTDTARADIANTDTGPEKGAADPAPAVVATVTPAPSTPVPSIPLPVLPELMQGLPVPVVAQPTQPASDKPKIAAAAVPAEAQAETQPEQPAATPDALVSLLALAGQMPQPTKPAVPSKSAPDASPSSSAPPAKQPEALPLPATAAPEASAPAHNSGQDSGKADVSGLLTTLDKAAGALDAAQSAVVRAAPEAQGFSLVANTDNQASGSQAPAYTAPAPAASLLSQSAVENLNALSVQINKRLSEGNTKFAMELHPADLGRVDVALTITKNGQMSAHLSFDTPVTAEVFAQHETELRHQLAQTGLQLADDALTFSSRVKPVETAVVTHTNTENRSQDSLSQNGQQNNQHNGQQQAQAQLNDQQGRPSPQARQAARALASAGEVADAADLDAAITAALNTPSRSSSRLALNLIV